MKTSDHEYLLQPAGQRVYTDRPASSGREGSTVAETTVGERRLAVAVSVEGYGRRLSRIPNICLVGTSWRYTFPKMAFMG